LIACGTIEDRPWSYVPRWLFGNLVHAAGAPLLGVARCELR
jgi:hypothetical protein